jgi:DNA-binding NarL/FixJ family response regulator
VRVIVADDALLVRQGIGALLEHEGIRTVGAAADAAELMALVAIHRPDAAVVDIRMPPTHRDEGIVAAGQIRALYPSVAVLVLSQYVQLPYAMRLLRDGAGRVGYLLKDRLGDAATLTDALRRVVAGECVVDPALVDRLLRNKRAQGPLSDLTEREREVLRLMAEGRSNRAIETALMLSPKTVETHIGRIFRKLGLDETPAVHRRVLAVLTHLRFTES